MSITITSDGNGSPENVRRQWLVSEMMWLDTALETDLEGLANVLVMSPFYCFT